MIDLLSVLFLWNVVGILLAGVEGYMIQLTIIVLYGSLVILGFMLYSNGGGMLIVISALLLFNFVSVSYDISVLILLAIMLLLIILV